MVNPTKTSRRQQILESLASMLQDSPGERITTAALAKKVGVSEAALYRHFPSKSKMFEGLIEFIEESIFSRITIILNEEATALKRCEKILILLLTFTERNPGITRLLTGDVLTGETGRLRVRVVQFFERVETQFRQILREAELREGLRPVSTVGATANLLVSYIDGRITQFVRTEFRQPPTGYWAEHWLLLSDGLLRSPDHTP